MPTISLFSLDFSALSSPPSCGISSSRKEFGLGPDDSRTPVLVVVYAIIASLAAGLAAKEVADFSQITAPVGIGALAGLFSSFLLAMLLLTYHTHPGHPPVLKKKG